LKIDRVAGKVVDEARSGFEKRDMFEESFLSKYVAVLEEVGQSLVVHRPIQILVLEYGLD